MPFALDELPEAFNKEPNNTLTNAQKVTLPVIVNGHIGEPDDWDVFRFTAKANDTVVAEVQARQVGSPLDSVIKLTDATGRLLAFSDDCEDLGGVNTHHADSWFVATLPADGPYFVHIGDTARHGGEDFAYRLRISPPQPDFELLVVPSSIRIRTNSSTTVTVYAQRKDGLTNSIKLELKDPPPGFSAAPVRLASGQNSGVLTIKGPSARMNQPVSPTVVGSAKVGAKTNVHEAIATDDQMQAFLWRHLVPATDLKAIAYDPAYEPPPKRLTPARPAPVTTTTTNLAGTTNAFAGTNRVVAATTSRPRFTKQQIARRLRELQRLYEEDFLTDSFYHDKVAECDATQ